MLKKTMTYVNLDGHQVTEDFYFNLTKAELVKIHMIEGEGFQEYLQNIVKSGNGKEIIETFDKILELAYGERTPDGKFQKSGRGWETFRATEAYSDIFMEIVTEEGKAAEFITAIMPDNLVEASNVQDTPLLPAEGPKDYSKLSNEELMALPQHELIEAFKQKNAPKL